MVYKTLHKKSETSLVIHCCILGGGGGQTCTPIYLIIKTQKYTIDRWLLVSPGLVINKIQTRSKN
jgi:hypothetical protein